MRRTSLFVLTTLSLLASPPAAASTSAALPLETLLDRATSIALVDPQESHAIWEAGRIVTYTHVHVAETIAGMPVADTWIRTLGGVVGDVGQVVEGEADLHVRSVVFLRKHDDEVVVVGRAQGQYLAPVENGSIVLRAPSFTGKLEQPRRGSARDPVRTYPLAGRPYADAARALRIMWEARHASR